MSDQPPSQPSFITRIFIAFAAYWKILLSGEAAARWLRPALPPETPTTPVPEIVEMKEATPEAALQLLAILQREGRLVDFLEDDISAYSDEEIGAAARVVHQGCRAALREHIAFERVRSEDEDSRISIAAGFNAREVRLTGNVTGEPPFSGTLIHRGWRVGEINLPKLAPEHDVRILTPAEVEL